MLSSHEERVVVVVVVRLNNLLDSNVGIGQSSSVVGLNGYCIARNLLEFDTGNEGGKDNLESISERLCLWS